MTQSYEGCSPYKVHSGSAPYFTLHLARQERVFNRHINAVGRFHKNVASRPCVPPTHLLDAARRRKSALYHNAVVAELVDAQR